MWISTTWYGIGAFVGPLIALPLFEKTNMFVPFWISGILTLILGISYWWYFYFIYDKYFSKERRRSSVVLRTSVVFPRNSLVFPRTSLVLPRTSQVLPGTSIVEWKRFLFRKEGKNLSLLSPKVQTKLFPHWMITLTLKCFFVFWEELFLAAVVVHDARSKGRPFFFFLL